MAYLRLRHTGPSPVSYMYDGARFELQPGDAREFPEAVAKHLLIHLSHRGVQVDTGEEAPKAPPETDEPVEADVDPTTMVVCPACLKVFIGPRAAFRLRQHTLKLHPPT